MDIADFCLLHHARVHASDVASVEGGSLVDQVLSGLADADLRARPVPTLNSLAWLLWHMARSEDVYVNVLLMNGTQVLDETDWAARLRVARRDTGSGMVGDEVTMVSEMIDIPALRAYRTAVGKATRAAIIAVAPQWWTRSITQADVDRLVASGAFVPSVVPIIQRLVHRTHGGVLGSLAITHNAGHLGEAQTVRSLFGGRPA